MTAEFALALPAVGLVLALCLGGLQLSTQRLRLQDAAAVAARSASRGGGVGAARDAVGRLVPGATVHVTSAGGLLCVDLARAGSPAPFGGLILRATACSPASVP